MLLRVLLTGVALVACNGVEDQPTGSSTPPAAPSATAVSADSVAGNHILIAYRGALRAKPAVTRSREDASRLAGELVARLRAGEDFADLAKRYSDDTSASRGGESGIFTREHVRKPFDVLFTLEPGRVADVAETEYGFHIIQRAR
ncbi:MAG TPA: peptidylprolyl isomerase [Polyangiaceae bacterium]|nr:peptidylprolyl isomerase [Polyangiaceae bacterium]